MGRFRGRRRKLVDMGEYPQEAYEPPPDDECGLVETHGDMTDTEAIRSWQKIYQGKVVNFCIIQLVLEDDRWQEVAHIDCCHAMIHRHQLTRDGQNYHRGEITAIPAGEQGRNVVDEGFTQAYDVMLNEWEDNHWRWKHGR